jgi:copper transport protein
LAFFVYSLWTLRSTPAELRRSIVTGLIRRFSALALIAVGVLTLTGVYSAVVQVGEWSALLGTTYGQMLLVKLLIALPMVALGAVNLLVHRPALQQRGNATRVPLFQRTVTGEAALSVALLLSVSILTSIPPAVTNAALPALKGVQTVDDLSVAVEVVPGRIGMNDFTVQINVNGQPLTGAREVEVQFAPESGKLSPNKVPLIPTGDGRYTVRGAYFSLPDRWQMRVAVRREGVFDSYAQFSFDVGVNRTVAIPWGTVCAALLAVAGVIYGLTVYSYTGARRAGFIGMGLMPALGLLAAAGIVFARPPLQETIGPINPVPPTAESVATGRAAYIINCLPCHGPRGKGDGSIGMTLNPRPADLSQHAVPGVHSDAQLYDWITNGYPGSVMPAFKANLSDEQRWHVVNYLREELAKHAVP